MPTLIMDSSPKFITCPDCGERYDNAKKRRLIDICGHPRCYSCLFVDTPCPLCEKSPKQRPRARSSSTKESSNESLDKDVMNNTVGSHPNLSELHKERSSTLPRPYRKDVKSDKSTKEYMDLDSIDGPANMDSHFKSLYRHKNLGSSDSLSSRSSSPPSGRPRSLPPSYHVSIENLNEQFWKSVELAEKKWSPRKRNNNKEKQETTKNPNETGNNVRPDVVECPAPDVIQLPVPANTHPKSQLEHHLRGRGDKKSVPARRIFTELIERPRSFSDVDNNQRCRSAACDGTDGSCDSFTRPLSWSPTQFPMNYRPPSSRASSSRYSDSSSIYLSDTWSESSDSDSIQSPTQEKTEINGNSMSSDEHGQVHSPSRKYKGNPLANVTYWVVNSGSSVEVHKGCVDNNDRAVQYRSPKAKVTHQWNGPTENGLVSTHSANSTM